MNNRVFIPSLLILFALCIFQTSYASDKYIVGASTLNVRDKASVNSNVMGKLSQNDIIVVVERVNDDWVVIDYNGQLAFVSSKHIQRIDGSLEASEEENDVLKIFLIVFGIILLTGVILGYTKTIVVYRDFADLTKVFLLVLIPIVVLLMLPENLDDELHKDLIIYGIVSFVVLMLIWIVVATFKDNRNIIWTVLALLVKLPLAIIFLAYLNNFFSSKKDSTIQEQIKDKISAGVVLLFILGLVRNKVWRYKPNQIQEENSIYNQLGVKIQSLKQDRDGFKFK